MSRDAIALAGPSPAVVEDRAEGKLVRSGVYLVLNSGATAGLGLIFWLVAARLYPTVVVGRNSALIAAMMTISGLAQLNYARSLSKSLPTAGRAGRRRLLEAYGVSGGASTLGCLAIVAGGLALTGNLGYFFHPWWVAASFLPGLLVWNVFALEDGALSAMQASWVIPLENGAYGVLKLVALAVVAKMGLPSYGIFLATIVPLVAIVIPVNVVLFGRILHHPVPAAGADLTTLDRPEAPGAHRRDRLDLLGYMFWLCGTLPITVLVAATLGAKEAGVLYIPFSIGTTLDLLSLNIGNVITAEVLRAGVHITPAVRHVFWQALRFLALMAFVGILASHLVLAPFGHVYDHSGRIVFIAVLAAAVPRTLTIFVAAICRARGEGGRIAYLFGITTTGVLGAGWLFLRVDGLRGFSVVWLAVNVAVGALSLGIYVRLRHADAAVTSGLLEEVLVPRRRDWPYRPICGAVFVAAGAVIGFGALARATAGGISALGLITTLPILYFVGVAVTVAAFFVVWWSPREGRARTWTLVAAVAVTTVLLTAAPTIVEPDARFATSWLIAGFTNAVAGHGATYPAIDARFSWPAFFGLAGIVDRLAREPSAVAYLKWWPTAINLLYLPFIWAIARRLTKDQRAAWLATLLFPFLNWVGQTYYSPQSVGLLLYLTAFLLVLATLAEDRGGPRRRATALVGHVTWWRKARPAALYPNSTERTDAIWLGLLLVCTTAITIEHQLSPVALCLLLGALSLLGLARLRLFPILFGVMVVGWICYFAEPYWSGHLSTIFGGLGHVLTNVGAGSGSRYRGSPTHEHIVLLRTAIVGGVWLLGVVAAIFTRPGWGRRVLICALIVPFGILGGQSYGGEGTLRVYLFSLAGACPLLGVLGSRLARRAATAWVVPVVIALLVPIFVVAAWGNETYEGTTPQDLATVQQLYTIAPAGSTLMALTPQLPWEYENVGVDTYRVIDQSDALADPIAKIDHYADGTSAATYLVVTTSEIHFGEQVYGLPNDWAISIESDLEASGYWDVAYGREDTMILEHAPVESCEVRCQ